MARRRTLRRLPRKSELQQIAYGRSAGKEMNVINETTWTTMLDSIASAEFITLRLFQNNHVPLLSDTTADYTQADFSGYSGGQPIVWGVAFINGSKQGEIDGVLLIETHDAGGVANTIYGVYVVNGAGNLRYAERFPAPISMSALGDQIKYVPIVTLINQ